VKCLRTLASKATAPKQALAIWYGPITKPKLYRKSSCISIIAPNEPNEWVLDINYGVQQSYRYIMFIKWPLPFECFQWYSTPVLKITGLPKEAICSTKDNYYIHPNPFYSVAHQILAPIGKARESKGRHKNHPTSTSILVLIHPI
jgi:hypothetical protein